ncbi:hypothetical protein AS52_03657 [Priestia megaterium Q3]|uniref:Lipoprotein n=1 Tax=Priestia megaterium Q3 TaxID=1452722 RepID=A0A806TLI7_PRIMG|nr:hypothetical protein [Priestia megaterium]AKP78618.1 hypothetical protein AS52_03657 [Priestia megaterium Q3]
MTKQKQSIIICTLPLLLLAGCTNSDYKEEITKGNQALDNKEYEQAAKAFNKALQDKKGDQTAKALYQVATDMKLATQKFEQGKYKEVLSLSDKVTEVNTNDAVKHDIRNLEQQSEKQKIIKDNQNYIENAETLIKKEDYSNAKKELEQVIDNTKGKKELTVQNNKAKELLFQVDKHFQEQKQEELIKKLKGKFRNGSLEAELQTSLNADGSIYCKGIIINEGVTNYFETAVSGINKKSKLFGYYTNQGESEQSTTLTLTETGFEFYSAYPDGSGGIVDKFDFTQKISNDISQIKKPPLDMSYERAAAYTKEAMKKYIEEDEFLNGNATADDYQYEDGGVFEGGDYEIDVWAVDEERQWSRLMKYAYVENDGTVRLEDNPE